MKEQILALAAKLEEASKSPCVLASLQAADEHRIRTRVYADIAEELRSIVAEADKPIVDVDAIQTAAVQGLGTARAKVTETVDAIATSETVAKVGKVADKVTEGATEALDGVRDRASKLFGNLADRLKRDGK